MPAIKRPEPAEKVSVYISASLMQDVRLILCDPRTGAMPQGSHYRLNMSGIVEKALREWVSAQKVHSS